MSRYAVVGALVIAALFGVGTLLGGWLLLAAGAGAGETTSCADGQLDARAVPPELEPIFQRAADAYGLGLKGPAVLAGLTSVESDFGRNLGPSSAGAVGWTQFMPATWQRFGVDADGDGRRDPMDPIDAIASAANYLRHLGAPRDWRRALLGYNHSEAYVREVLRRAGTFAGAMAGGSTAVSRCDFAAIAVANGQTERVWGGGRIVPIPGQPGELADDRIVRDIEYLIARYHVAVAAGYSTTGHAPDGEHPLGLAVDLVPGPGGTWDDVDALARWAEPEQNHPRSPFRWVGYDGDPGHGRGNHLHLSWEHGLAPSRRPPAPWVQIFSVP